MEQPPLGLDAGSGQPERAVKVTERRLTFATNRHNLLEVLSSLIVGPREVYPKYYADLLVDAPGRVPLWGGPLPAGLVGRVNDSDDPASFPVAVEFRVELAEDVPVLEDGGTLLLAPEGPLLLTNAVVLFRSAAERSEHASQQYENIDHARFRYEVDESLFSATFDVGFAQEWLRGLHPGPDVSAVFRTADAATGALALVAHLLPPRERPARDLALVLGGASPAGGEPLDGLAPWLSRAQLIAPALPDKADADQVVFASALQVLTATDAAAGGRPTEFVRSMSDTAKAAKGARGAAKAADGALAWVRDVIGLKTEFDAANEKVLASARGVAMALLRPDPRRVAAFIREAGSRQPWVSSSAAALVGARSGRRRLPAEMRPASLDALLAELAVGICLGRLPTWTTSVTEPTGPRNELDLLVNGRAVLALAIEKPTLADLLFQADLAQQPAKRVAIELARSLRWDETIESDLVLPEGPYQTRYDKKRQRIVLSFAGFPTVERRVLDEPFRARLRNESIPDDVAGRLSGDLLGGKEGP